MDLVTFTPGIYDDIPAWDYFPIDALSSSAMKLFAQSPAAYALGLEESKEDTDATLFGNGLHDLTLMGADYFAEHYPPEPTLEGRLTKTGKPASNARSTESFRADVKALVDAGKGARILKAETADLVRSAAGAMRSHPEFARLEAEAVAKERTVIWEEETEFGPRLCKARLDMVGPGWILDLKKCRAMDIIGRFARQCWDFGYFRQAAWYRRGYAAVTGETVGDYYLGVVCSDATHEREVLQLSNEDLAWAEKEAVAILHSVCACEAAGEFPRGEDDIVPIEMEPWMRKKLRQD